MTKLIYDIKPYRENQPEKESVVYGITTTCYHQTKEQFESQRIIDLRTYKVKHIPINYDIHDIDHFKPKTKAT